MPPFTRTAALSGLLLALAMATATPAQDLDTLRPVADQGAAERAKLAQVMVDSIFSFGELGFQEVETSRYITGVLRDNGFEIEEGHRRHPHRLDGALGLGFAGDRARQRHRRDPEGVPKTRRRLPRAAGRGRPRTR